MKYFSPSYWFKLWVLSAPLFNDKTQGINAKSIDNKNIKDWTSKNTSDISLLENQELISSNSTAFTTEKSWNIFDETNNTISNSTNFEKDLFYENFLKTQGWSKNPQESQKQEHLIQEEHHQFLKQQHEKIRNRIKRGLNGGNEFDAPDSAYYTLYVLFKPDFWEEIVNLKIKYSLEKNLLIEEVKNKVKNEFYFHPWYYSSYTIGHKWTKQTIRYVSDELIKNVVNSIFQNFWTIANKFIDSSRRERIIIKMKNELYSRKMSEIHTKSDKIFDSVNIKTDDNNYYSNKYLDNLERDFPDWNKNININLGLINNNIDNDIRYAIKQKYPDFDISTISIVDKTDYSNFCKCFIAKIYVSTDSQYSFGNLRPTFTYVTQTKLNELNSIIANDPKFKQWIKHMNDYNKNLPTKIENLKMYTDSQKWSSKNTEKEILKSYIRDWSYVSTLIEHELKLDELNKNVQGLKSSFDSIKNQVNELEKRIENLENKSNANCANIATVTAGVASAIPIIGTVVTVASAIPIIGTVAGTVAAVTAGACAIAGV